MIDEKTYNRYATNPAEFRAELLVDVDGIARRFGDVTDEWQRADFAALDAGLMRCVGQSTEAPQYIRAWLERPRGHSKTTDLAITCAWALAFASRPPRGYCYAADRDQAALLKDAISTLLLLNPWLGEILSVQKNQVVNTAAGHPGEGGRLEISTSDVGSSYGILPDFIIADEVVHWEGDGSLWHSLLSSAAKRSHCLLVAITNAGFADSWQWKIREAARADSSWYFSRLDGPQASWMTEERLAEQERMLPPVAFARLWRNEWSSGGGDALTPTDIAAAFANQLAPLSQRREGWSYVAGLDLGVSRDAAAIVVLGIRKANRWEPDCSDHGKIRLVFSERWKPAKGRKVNLSDVETTLLTLHRRFDFAQVNYDPWQAEHMSQRLTLLRLPMVEVTSTGSNLQRIATTLMEAFADRRFELYDDGHLRRDLLRMRVEERSYGFRLVSPRDETGHGNTATALGLAALAASDIAGKPTIMAGAFTGDTPLQTYWADRLLEYDLERQLLSGSGDDTYELLREGLEGLRFNH